jgi:hypothetical protein
MGSDIRTLISRGRKAGLRTSELYSALAGRPAEGRDVQGQADCNGFVLGTNQQGQNVYRPLNGQERG